MRSITHARMTALTALQTCSGKESLPPWRALLGLTGLDEALVVWPLSTRKAILSMSPVTDERVLSSVAWRLATVVLSVERVPLSARQATACSSNAALTASILEDKRSSRGSNCCATSSRIMLLMLLRSSSIWCLIEATLLLAAS
jgi:hypothetical protein